MRAIFFIYIVSFITYTQLQAQQFPIIRTTNNLYEIANPATFNTYYLVNEGSLAKWSIHGFGRNSWLGFEGSPKTAGMKIDFNNYENNKIRASIGVLNDAHGAFNNTSGFFRFAYDIISLSASKKNSISLGLGYFHANSYSINLDDVTFVNTQDPLQSNITIDEPANLITIGIFGSTGTTENTFYAGLSSMFIPSNINKQLLESHSLNHHFYANAGFIRRLNDKYSLEFLSSIILVKRLLSFGSTAKLHHYKKGDPDFTFEFGYEEALVVGSSFYLSLKNHVYQLSPIARFFKEGFGHSLELQFSILFNQN